MSRERTYNEASDVRAEDGDVLVTGPDAVDVALTPEAAETTGERLIEESVRATGQRRLRGIPRPQ